MTSSQKIRQDALARAIVLGVNQKWSATTVLQAARKFESYLKGDEDEEERPSAFEKKVREYAGL